MRIYSQKRLHRLSDIKLVSLAFEPSKAPCTLLNASMIVELYYKKLVKEKL